MFDIEAWKAAVIADLELSPDTRARTRWALVADLAADDGTVTASLATIGRTIGFAPGSGTPINVVSRLEAGGRLHRITRGHGAIVGTYQLIPTVAEPAEPAATILQHPTDRAALLRLAREIGEALLAA